MEVLELVVGANQSRIRRLARLIERLRTLRLFPFAIKCTTCCDYPCDDDANNYPYQDTEQEDFIQPIGTVSRLHLCFSEIDGRNFIRLGDWWSIGKRWYMAEAAV
jgi:hypothetical protein